LFGLDAITDIHLMGLLYGVGDRGPVKRTVPK